MPITRQGVNESARRCAKDIISHPTIANGATMRPVSIAALSVLAVLVASCGGGGGGSTTPAPQIPAPAPAPATAGVALAIRVMDGPVSNALVCLDKNDNDACDASEPSGRTDAAGRAVLDVDVADVGRYPVLAQVGTNAVDADFGPVASAYLMKAPADRVTLVTPLTTIVQAAIENSGATTEDADRIARDQLGLSSSLLRDYSGLATADDAKLFALARMLVLSNQKFTTAWQGAVGAAVPGGSPVADADIQRLARERLFENLPWVYAQIGEAAVLPALAARDAAQLNTALASRVTSVWNTAGIAVGGVPALVGIARAMKTFSGATSAGGWFDGVSASSSQNWSVVYSTYTAAAGGAGARTFVEHRQSMRNGILRALGSTTPPSALRWNGTAWTQCPVNTSNQRSAPDGSGRTVSTACGDAWRTVGTRVEVDVSGQRIADVRQATSGTFFDTWSIDAVTAGNAAFPPGSKIAYQRQVGTRGLLAYEPRRGNVATIAPAALSSGSATACSAAAQAPALAWGVEATTLEAVIGANPGVPCSFAPDASSGARNEWWDATTVSLGKASADPGQNATDPGYTYERLIRASFGSGNSVTFHACRQRYGDGSARNCDAIGTGTYSIATLGDARLMTFDGLPFDRALAGQASPSGRLTGMAHPVLIERGNKVYFGQQAPLSQFSTSALNTQAANAVLALSGAGPIDPALQVVFTAASYQGDWLFWDASTDYGAGASTTLAITSQVKLGASPGTGYGCTANSAGVPGAAVTCTLALDASTGTATVTLPTGTAALTLDVNTGILSGTFTPISGPTTTLTGGLK